VVVVVVVVSVTAREDGWLAGWLVKGVCSSTLLRKVS